MEAHVLSTYPEEGCGVLIGGKNKKVEKIIPLKNVFPESRERRFSFDPFEFLKAEKQAQKEGLEVIGIFHSHPHHPAYPSSFDLERSWPFYSYLIFSVSKGKILNKNSFILEGKQFEKEEIKLA